MQISTKVLGIIVAVLCVILLALVGVVAWMERDAIIIAIASPEKLFEKGEYYFNHDDDPAGPYDLVKARRYYEAAIAASSTANAMAWHQLARIEFLEGDFNASIDRFHTQQDIFGDELPSVHYMLGLVYGFKAKYRGNGSDWDRAAEEFKTFIEFEPEAPWPRIDLAWVYFSQGKYEEMIPTLVEGLEYEPGNAWLHNMYGLALLNTGKRVQAHEHFLLAQRSAAELTVEDWGNAYPGNDPAAWPAGLAAFREAIEMNVALTERSSSDE